MEGLHGLRILALEQTAVTDEGLKVLKHFPDLEELSLMESRDFTDEGLVCLSSLTRLKRLSLRWTFITGTGLPETDAKPARA